MEYKNKDLIQIVIVKVALKNQVKIQLLKRPPGSSSYPIQSFRIPIHF